MLIAVALLNALFLILFCRRRVFILGYSLEKPEGLVKEFLNRRRFPLLKHTRDLLFAST